MLNALQTSMNIKFLNKVCITGCFMLYLIQGENTPWIIF